MGSVRDRRRGVLGEVGQFRMYRGAARTPKQAPRMREAPKIMAQLYMVRDGQWVKVGSPQQMPEAQVRQNIERAVEQDPQLAWKIGYATGSATWGFTGDRWVSPMPPTEPPRAVPSSPIVLRDGIQVLNAAANADIAGDLGRLYFGAPVPTPAEGVQTFIATTCDQAKQSGGPNACDATALNKLQTQTTTATTVLIDFQDKSRLMVILAWPVPGGPALQETLQSIAGPGSNMAVFEVPGRPHSPGIAPQPPGA